MGLAALLDHLVDLLSWVDFTEAEDVAAGEWVVVLPWVTHLSMTDRLSWVVFTEAGDIAAGGYYIPHLPKALAD